MPLTKKKDRKTQLSEVIVVTKTSMLLKKEALPKKFEQMNEMLKKTKFLP